MPGGRPFLAFSVVRAHLALAKRLFSPFSSNMHSTLTLSLEEETI